MRRVIVSLIAALLCCGADWADVATPAPGPAQSIGFYSAGCLQGAQALALDGPGYEAIRVSRNRYWGQPVTIEFVRTLADRMRATGQAHLYIGDIGQPRGGPMSFGHASHQMGLDVDIWSERAPRPRRAPAEREQVMLRSLVQAGDGGIDDTVFSQQHVTLLKTAAEMPNLDRMFVSKWIKERLCHTATGNRAWLRKLVPWYGHDEHFHIRLYCPPGNPSCQPQADYPHDDGCGEALDSWFRKAPITPPPVTATPPKPYRPKLPAACAAVLKAP